MPLVITHTTPGAAALLDKANAAFAKVAQAQAEPAEATAPDLSAKLEALGQGEAAYRAAKKVVTAWEEARKALVSEAVDAAGGATANPYATIPLESAHFVGEVTEAKRVRSCPDMKALYEAMGPELFFAVAKVSLEEVDKYLTPAQKTLLLTTDPGARTLKIIPKGAAS